MIFVINLLVFGGIEVIDLGMVDVGIVGNVVVDVGLFSVVVICGIDVCYWDEVVDIV